MSPEILIALDFFQKWNKSEHGVTGGAEGEAGPAPGTEDSDCGVAVGPARGGQAGGDQASQHLFISSFSENVDAVTSRSSDQKFQKVRSKQMVS